MYSRPVQKIVMLTGKGGVVTAFPNASTTVTTAVPPLPPWPINAVGGVEKIKRWLHREALEGFVRDWSRLRRRWHPGVGGNHITQGIRAGQWYKSRSRPDRERSWSSLQHRRRN